MAGTKWDNQDVRHITEGHSAKVMAARATYNQHDSARPAFIRVVILDVISDPTIVDDTKLQYYQTLNVSNATLAAIAPRNSIIARRVIGNDSSSSESPMVFFPMLPPHIALPAKPGEHVWAMFENPDAASGVGYWLCRVTQPNFVEDVNYTHADRQLDRSFAPGLMDTVEGTATPVYEFRNGGVDSFNGERYTLVETISLPGGDEAYNELLTTSDASYITQYEPVPRYRKRPADMVFEGSNNTLICLGTDRTGPVATYTEDPTYGQEPAAPDADVFAAGAGSIDIVVGRGQTAATAGKSADNQVTGPELAKDAASLAPQEGDPDPINDRSRVLVAQATNADVNFGLDSFLTDGMLVGTMSDPSVAKSGAVITKSDRVRVIGRSDVAFMVTGLGTLDAAGLPTDNPDTATWATMGIKSTGDVYVQPTAAGSFDVETPSCNVTVNPTDLEVSTTACVLTMDQTDTKLTIGSTSIDANASGITSTVGSTSIAEAAGGVTITTPQVTLTSPAVSASGMLAVTGKASVGSLTVGNAPVAMAAGTTAVLASIADALTTLATALSSAVSGAPGAPIVSLTTAGAALTVAAAAIKAAANALPTSTPPP